METSSPVWIPPALNDAFKNIVIQAYTKPHLYHTQYVPLPWCIGFHGRPGMEKARVLQKLCLQYGLSTSCTLFTLKIGACAQVLHEIECVTRATSTVLDSIKDENEKLGPKHIIIVDEADILCYEPDSEQTLLKSIELAKICENNHVLFIGIFNRFPGEGTNVSPWIREVQNKFWTQFKSLLYIESPNAAFRISLFRFYIQSFVQHFNSVQQDRVIKYDALNEEDYERLADFSTFATPENIIVFLRKVFLHTLNNPNVSEITVDYIEGFTNVKYGSKHICDYDTREVDNAFATACGFGPAVKPKDKIIKKENLTQVTGFTEDNVNLQHVMQELKEMEGTESPSKKNKTE